MEKIELSKYNFQVNGKKVEYAHLKNITFKAFVDFTEQLVTVDDNREFHKKLMRLRMKNQVELYTTHGVNIPIDIKEIMNLPPKLGIMLASKINSEQSALGEIINDGDGIESPILFKLGTPLKLKEGEEITELEFQAKTYGDIEDMFAEPNMIKRAYNLITSVSTPVSNDLKFQKTPAVVADMLEYTDGILIANLIVPRFLDVDAN